MKKNLMLGILYVLLTIAGAIFFGFGRFSSTSFIIYIGMISLVALAFHTSDRLTELDLRNLKVVLAEIKDVKKDIYAKADEVRSMMIDVADSYLSSAVETGRIAGDGLSLQRDMVAKRERARALLVKAGLAQEEVQDRTAKVTNLIAWDLLGAIRDKVKERVQKRENPNSFFLPMIGESDPELNRRVVNKEGSEVIEGVEDYIKAHDLDPRDFVEDIAILKRFMDDDELPEEKKTENPTTASNTTS